MNMWKSRSTKACRAVFSLQKVKHMYKCPTPPPQSNLSVKSQQPVATLRRRVTVSHPQLCYCVSRSDGGYSGKHGIEMRAKILQMYCKLFTILTDLCDTQTTDRHVIFESIMILLSIVHIFMALALYYTTCAGPAQESSALTFPDEPGVGSFVLSCCRRGQEPRYSCHRRVWSPQGDMSEDDAKWHFSFHNDRLRRYPLASSSWPLGSGDAGGAAPLSRLRLRLRAAENLRTWEPQSSESSKLPIQTHAASFRFTVRHISMAQILGKLTQCNPYQLICPLFRLKAPLVQCQCQDKHRQLNQKP